ncbi:MULTISPECIES: hypothetical protein [unclassified Streptomyces]|uniref:hypothetical protein n=1 Tax=unclassified Streptomyces TaxID=2593676 RepID=UPI0033D98315
MIRADYALSDNPVVLREQVRVNLRKADLLTLCYSCFGGDLRLTVNEVDFSIVTGGGVQILDFAVEFYTAGRAIASGKNAKIEFAGMADEIYLVLSGAAVTVSCSYADGDAQIPKEEVVVVSREFLRKVLADLESRYPDLKKNENVKKMHYWA